MSDRAQPPVIVLVRPQLGENIGAVARAMLNFGLTELRLVEPRDGWPNPAAGPSASGADIVLDQATLHANTADAVADCAHVYATTMIKRGLVKPVVTPAEAATAIWSGAGRTALLFGPERSGLDKADVALARAILTIPINPDFGSLNLAQSVAVIAYEWSKGAGLAVPTEMPLEAPAPQAELEQLIAQVEELLAPANYFFPESRVAATRRSLRTLLTKPGWSSRELQMLRGIFAALQPRIRSNASNS